MCSHPHFVNRKSTVMLDLLPPSQQLPLKEAADPPSNTPSSSSPTLEGSTRGST